MEIAQEQDGNVVILKLSGRLDSSTAKAAEDRFVATVGDGAVALVIDMTALNYISSAGLRVLLITAKKIKHAGGKMALFGLTTTVREVFSISGFNSIFSIQPGRSAAIAAVR